MRLKDYAPTCAASNNLRMWSVMRWLYDLVSMIRTDSYKFIEKLLAAPGRCLLYPEPVC